LLKIILILYSTGNEMTQTFFICWNVQCNRGWYLNPRKLCLCVRSFFTVKAERVLSQFDKTSRSKIRPDQTRPACKIIDFGRKTKH
jgi:hypothetical protein